MAAPNQKSSKSSHFFPKPLLTAVSAALPATNNHEQHATTTQHPSVWSAGPIYTKAHQSISRLQPLRLEVCVVRHQFAELCAACDLRLARALCALLLLWACFSVLQIAAISGAIVLVSGSDSCEDLARKCLSLPEHILLRLQTLRMCQNATTVRFPAKRSPPVLERIARTAALHCHIQIFIKSPSGETIALDVERTDTIGTIKARMEGPSEQQRLIFGGRQLEDSQTVESYNIQQYNTLRLCGQLLGGEACSSSGEGHEEKVLSRGPDAQRRAVSELDSLCQGEYSVVQQDGVRHVALLFTHPQWTHNLYVEWNRDDQAPGSKWTKGQALVHDKLANSRDDIKKTVCLGTFGTALSYDEVHDVLQTVVKLTKLSGYSIFGSGLFGRNFANWKLPDGASIIAESGNCLHLYRYAKDQIRAMGKAPCEWLPNIAKLSDGRRVGSQTGNCRTFCWQVLCHLYAHSGSGPVKLGYSLILRREEEGWQFLGGYAWR